ncbi:MAG: 50S ribosomal protein L11 methyltransferase, partial [Alphaproteobacteria bacterium]
MSVIARLTAGRPEARRIAEFLERDFGDNGVAVAFFEAGKDWSVEAWFPEGTPQTIAATVRDHLGTDAFTAPVITETVPETDWVTESQKGLTPVIAGRFIVYGSHSRRHIPAGRIGIRIDAGQAFGTGHHGTTAGCLEMLDQLCRSRRFRNPLDLGTGSGVLAIALAKLLKVPVLATDIDPLAIRVARENAALNHVGPLVRPLTAPGLHHAAVRQRAPFDLIVANILAEPLMALAPQVARMLAPG